MCSSTLTKRSPRVKVFGKACAFSSDSQIDRQGASKPPMRLKETEMTALQTVLDPTLKSPEVQEVLEQHYTEKVKISLVLFDEIEKASDALWQLLLGILDKGTLTLGDNRRVDFSQSLVFLTSNLGSQEMSRLMSGGLGYTSGPREDNEELDQKIYRTATEAAPRKFSPEFMNRVDKVIVFRTLQRDHLEQILDIELARVQDRIMASTAGRQFVFNCTESARDFLLREGTDP